MHQGAIWLLQVGCKCKTQLQQKKLQLFGSFWKCKAHCIFILQLLHVNFVPLHIHFAAFISPSPSLFNNCLSPFFLFFLLRKALLFLPLLLLPTPPLPPHLHLHRILLPTPPPRPPILPPPPLTATLHHPLPRSPPLASSHHCLPLAFASLRSASSVGTPLSGPTALIDSSMMTTPSSLQLLHRTEAEPRSAFGEP